MKVEKRATDGCCDDVHLRCSVTGSSYLMSRSMYDANSAITQQEKMPWPAWNQLKTLAMVHKVLEETKVPFRKSSLGRSCSITQSLGGKLGLVLRHGKVSMSLDKRS
jgi:hypothetical protein